MATETGAAAVATVTVAEAAAGNSRDKQQSVSKQQFVRQLTTLVSRAGGGRREEGAG